MVAGFPHRSDQLTGLRVADQLLLRPALLPAELTPVLGLELRQNLRETDAAAFTANRASQDREFDRPARCPVRSR